MSDGHSAVRANNEFWLRSCIRNVRPAHLLVLLGRKDLPVTETGGSVLDEFLNACEEAIGKRLSIAHTGTVYYNEEASRDTIKHYAWGVTDMNPLWLDE